MKHLSVLGAMLVTMALVGCGTVPKTATEFRQQISDATFGKTETFVVHRKYYRVARTYKKMAKKCLRVRVKTTERTRRSRKVVVYYYTPTVKIRKTRAELHLQKSDERVNRTRGKKSNKGIYVFVADASRIGRNQTRIDMYYESSTSDRLVKAVKGWSKGKRTGCPDMTKD